MSSTRRLDIVQFQHPREQRRADFADRCSDGMSALAVKVPEHHRRRFRCKSCEADIMRALFDLRGHGTGHRQTSDVTLHVGHEDGYADPREPFGGDQQRYRFAGSGRARNEAVAIRVFRTEIDLVLALPEKNVGHTLFILGTRDCGLGLD
jgi:hypothetical protein